MADEKSRAEQEQQAESDAHYGRMPDPAGGQYYQVAYKQYVTLYQKPNEEPAPE